MEVTDSLSKDYKNARLQKTRSLTARICLSNDDTRSDYGAI